MDLDPNERATLMIASGDKEGRVWMVKQKVGPLVAFGGSDTPEIPLGEEGRTSLIEKGLLAFDGASSYILTRAGWDAIGKVEPAPRPVNLW